MRPFGLGEIKNVHIGTQKITHRITNGQEISQGSKRSAN